MPVEQPRQFIRQSRAEIVRLIGRMDDAANLLQQLPRERRPYRRESPRWPYVIFDLVLSVEHPGGGLARMLVYTRNLSAGGISLLHGGYLYPGTRCKMRLPRFDGALPTLSGAVVGCRCVEGIVHEINVAFDRRIDPMLFLQSQPERQTEFTEAVDLPLLTGTLLLLTDNEPDQLLLARSLQATSVDIVTAKQAEEALLIVKAEPPNLVMTDLSIGGSCGIEFIRFLRTIDSHMPIVLFTAETKKDRLECAFAAGADNLLSRPHDPSELFAMLFDIQRGGRGGAGRDPMYSEMELDEGMMEIVSQYVDYARRVAGDIDEACMEADVQRIRDLCLGIKGSASAVGYLPLGEAADEAIQAIDSGVSVDEAQRQVNRLRDLCLRVSVRQG